MKILMMTNTYSPIVGGVEHSIRFLTTYFTHHGHQVLIVAPSYKDMPKHEKNVIRIPAIQNFNHSGFSINLPMPGLLQDLMHNFKPDIVHSHHPFLIGDLALRLSGQYNVPLIFTYHTMYEEYLHYLPFNNNGAKRFIIELSAGYANLCNQVIAPSLSVKNILLDRDVQVPIVVIPTGIDLKSFSKGSGQVIRNKFNIPQNAFVLGHVGRLAKEKNLEFLTSVIITFLKEKPQAHFLIVGKGPQEEMMKQHFSESGISNRVHFTGVLLNQKLIDCYHAMDVFTFTSKSETQGMVLAESMAAGIPVVGIDSPGIRDVITDKINGRLIDATASEETDKKNYLSALHWCLQKPPQQFKAMKHQAKKSVKQFNHDHCAQKTLEIYKTIPSTKMNSNEINNSAWQITLQRVKAEWNMAKNFALASESSYIETSFENTPKKIIYPKDWIVKIRRWLNKHEWSAQFLNLSKSVGTESQPGLVIIQIDGFSRTQLQKAIKNKEMSFLKGLLKKERYKIYPLYSGLPSSTPSIQGELLYGVKQCIPAFSFFDTETKKIFTMFNGDDVLTIENRLKKQGEALLREGSSYSNVLEGGAQQAHFCAGSLNWSRIWKDSGPISIALLAVTHILTFVKILFLVCLELLISSLCFIAGFIHGESPRKELKFILTRASICILLRELVTLGAKIDIARGVPIIHINYLGYDEQAHRRGPSSKFAHWALKGIDHSIAGVYKTALNSSRRNYDIWIYSDHGQEDVDSYIKIHGCRVHEKIKKIFKKLNLEKKPQRQYDKKREVFNQHLGNALLQNFFMDNADIHQGDIIVTAVGPTGNIYIQNKLTDLEKSTFAYKLVHSAGIPTVLSPEKSGKVRVWNKKGVFLLPDQAKEVLGKNHPYLKEVTSDLISVCHHPNAGTFTFSGWSPGNPPLSFPIESGAHAGPGSEETNAFALLPSDIVSFPKGKEYLRSNDLRKFVLKLLRRGEDVPEKENPSIAENKKSTTKKTIRIMTYNVHSCVGMDGKTSPERIARVIGRHEPDIVALQELDMKRLRTGNIDQPHLIAKRLKMIYHFHPSFSIEEEHYGNAIISRYPIELIRAGKLPTIKNKSKLETRGALSVNVKIGEQQLQIINTHLGLRRKERLKQARELISEKWRGQASYEPTVLCGDFNALPGSPTFKCLTQKYADAQIELDNHRPHPTWFSHFPIGRIDHLFINSKINVVNVEVSKTKLDKISSDHLPLIVDIEIKD
ncbi:glycosyltransferase [Candidatus Omnitrophota bacterium]